MSISEVFVSVQGEGIDVGKPAVFLRTAGCPLRCLYCDTKYAWQVGNKQEVNVLVSQVREFHYPYVVITGGEPLSQKALSELILAISSLDFVRLIDVESSGCIFRDDFFYRKVRLTLSPKPPSMGVEFPGSNVLKFLSLDKPIFLKFPILDEEDFEFIKDFLYENKQLIREEIVLQPISNPAEDYRETVKRVIELVISDKKFMNDFDVRVLPQVHKLIGIK